MSKRPIVKLLKIMLPILLGAFLIWYSLSKLSFAGIISFAKNADYSYILLGVFFGLLSHLSRAYRWVFMLEPLGYKIRLGNSIMAVFATYLINYTIPRAGEVARASILTNYEGVPFEKGFGTIVAERIADMIVMLVIIGITLFMQFDFIYSFLSERFNVTKIIMGGLVLSLLGLLFIFLIKRSSSKIAIKIKDFVNGLVEGALSIFKMKKKWAFIFHTLFIWIMYLLMFYVTSLAFSDLNDIPLGAILIGFILATFSVAATNGGIGSYPEAIVIAFSLFSLPEDSSRAFGWIMWSSSTILIFICGGISLLYLPFFNRNK
ncbi:YbhN family protein [Psychroserpens sp. NJDZ02]|uniref:lysylphosphatidylglycerol synthase transmembrane domain-containing protein n=1 Tax=Psychroserpens sp. NJDZ02 TaxID=2570561 RepID=UPI0010A7D518|nr:lysylphosphatidylglycerol synthase transmembrane domain-containing protein [Psychroserpens sp. NJDZ02]QCE41416.1 flippase-like domain-containing protein [Psychroserpens sp. NJDZ02]